MTFDEKRKKEFEFFLDELRKLGDQGLRPHQAYKALSLRADEGTSTEQDKFYWEGVYGQEFDEEAIK